jgi:hypothetical protein
MSKNNATPFSVSSIGPDKDYNNVKQLHFNAQQTGKQTGKRLPNKVAVIEHDTGHVKMFFDSLDARAYRDEVGGMIYYPGTGPEVSYLMQGAPEKKILKYDRTWRSVADVSMAIAQNQYKTPGPVKFDFHDMYNNIMVPRPALTHGAKQYQTIRKEPFPRDH